MSAADIVLTAEQAQEILAHLVGIRQGIDDVLHEPDTYKDAALLYVDLLELLTHVRSVERAIAGAKPLEPLPGAAPVVNAHRGVS